jgi:5'-methylthioadenosine phosphorylase
VLRGRRRSPDYDCWREHEPGVSADAIMESIIANLSAGTANAVELLKRAVPKIAALSTGSGRPEQGRMAAAAARGACPCPSALAKAIWTDRKAIDPKAVEKLRPLVGKYLA